MVCLKIRKIKFHLKRNGQMVIWENTNFRGQERRGGILLRGRAKGWPDRY